MIIHMFENNSFKNFIKIAQQGYWTVIRRHYFFSFLKSGTRLLNFQISGNIPSNRERLNIIHKGMAIAPDTFFYHFITYQIGT